MLVVMGLFSWLHKRHGHGYSRDDDRHLWNAIERLKHEEVQDDSEERARMERRIEEARRQVHLERKLMCRRHTDRRPT